MEIWVHDRDTDRFGEDDEVGMRVRHISTWILSKVRLWHMGMGLPVCFGLSYVKYLGRESEYSPSGKITCKHANFLFFFSASLEGRAKKLCYESEI